MITYYASLAMFGAQWWVILAGLSYLRYAVKFEEDVITLL